ncbi:MAG: hypothetical protein A2096_08200 [Spirochaetes bacterium GWF1_41_5]|nr:MAG: hypothetical protein A2096_08200 [Spirochaetes bacterium GWF1_41_5]HBE04229.1 hypothetical protein [Spirochaetia bacterium]
MQRDALKKLISWKSSSIRKPLIVRGARQVGKTWLLQELDKTYSRCAYINFDNNKRMKSVFAGGFDISQIISALQIESGVKIEPGNTLVIFDEVQEVSAWIGHNPGGSNSLGKPAGQEPEKLLQAIFTEIRGPYFLVRFLQGGGVHQSASICDNCSDKYYGS